MYLLKFPCEISMRGKILHDRANNSRQILKLTTVIVETKNTLRSLKLLKVSSSKVALKHLIIRT